MIDEIIESLTIQMIKDRFSNKNIKEEKFIITKQELYNFIIKFLKIVKEVYDNNKDYK